MNTTSVYAGHYARVESLVDALAVFNDVAEHLTRYDRDLMLGFLLPGIPRLQDCWTELGEPLEQYARLDGHLAVSIEQERGYRFPNSADSYARIRDELRLEIAAVITQYRAGDAPQPTGLQAVPA